MTVNPCFSFFSAVGSAIPVNLRFFLWDGYSYLQWQGVKHIETVVVTIFIDSECILN